MSRFHACQAITARWEGGWSDHPDDPGGKTMYGLTSEVWSAYLKRHGKPPRPVRTATRAEVEELFKRQYWDVVRGDQLPPGIDLMVYDFAINSGPARAVRHLQAALGVKQDGVVGHVTLAAAREAYDRDQDGDVILAMARSRLAFLQGLRTWRSFGRGWTNRVKDVGQRAARMEAIEDQARTFALAGKEARQHRRTDPAEPPEIYQPDKAGPPLPDPVTPAPPLESPSLWSLGGLLTSVIGALSNGWALAGLLLLLLFLGVGVWAWRTGRLSFNRPEMA